MIKILLSKNGLFTICNDFSIIMSSEVFESDVDLLSQNLNSTVDPEYRPPAGRQSST